MDDRGQYDIDPAELHRVYPADAKVASHIALAVVEIEVIHPFRNSDMVFVKYRCPLHRSTVQLLADSAMTYL